MVPTGDARYFPDSTTAPPRTCGAPNPCPSTPSPLPGSPAPHRSTFDRAAVVADLREIARLPGLLREVVAGASEQDLSRTWREGSWTVAQLVHHILDSHIHSYTRCKFALCETNPSIKPYDENTWVTTPDCTPASVEETLDLLELLHAVGSACSRGWTKAPGTAPSTTPNATGTSSCTSKPESTPGMASTTSPRPASPWASPCPADGDQIAPYPVRFANPPAKAQAMAGRRHTRGPALPNASRNLGASWQSCGGDPSLPFDLGSG